MVTIFVTTALCAAVTIAIVEIYILSINETKLNEIISDNEVNILGYDIVRRDRTTDGGGGVCFYVKKSINFTEYAMI